MTTVTVFPHAPPPVIGVCGVVFVESPSDTASALARIVERSRRQADLPVAG